MLILLIEGVAILRAIRMAAIVINASQFYIRIQKRGSSDKARPSRSRAQATGLVFCIAAGGLYRKNQPRGNNQVSGFAVHRPD
jgi:hypothetical protein